MGSEGMAVNPQPDYFFTPLPSQLKMFHVPWPDDVRLDICVYQGGYGSGKTQSGMVLGNLLAQKYPKTNGLVVAKTYPLLRDTTVETYFETFDSWDMEQGKDFEWNENRKRLTFPNGSKIFFRSIDKPWKLKSLNVAWAHIEEAAELTEADFRMVLSRVRQKGVRVLRIFGTTNPQATKSWIYKETDENGGIREIEVNGDIVKVGYRRIIAPTTENPHIPPEQIAAMKSSYDPEYYRIYVLGEDGNYTAGLVVHNWDETVNVSAAAEYDAKRKIYLTCDFNVDPMCWALTHIGLKDGLRYYDIFDEVARENTNIPATAEKFAQKYRKHKQGIILTGDASGRQRSDMADKENMTRYQLLYQTLSDLGCQNISIDVPNKNPSIASRIARFNGVVCSVDDVRRVRVHPRCKKVKHILSNLKYVPGTDQVYQPTPTMIKEDSSLKWLRQDMYDAVSYMVSHYEPTVAELMPKRSGGPRTHVYKPSR